MVDKEDAGPQFFSLNKIIATKNFQKIKDNAKIYHQQDINNKKIQTADKKKQKKQKKNKKR